MVLIWFLTLPTTHIAKDQQRSTRFRTFRLADRSVQLNEQNAHYCGICVEPVDHTWPGDRRMLGTNRPTEMLPEKEQVEVEGQEPRGEWARELLVFRDCSHSGEGVPASQPCCRCPRARGDAHRDHVGDNANNRPQMKEEGEGGGEGGGVQLMQPGRTTACVSQPPHCHDACQPTRPSRALCEPKLQLTIAVWDVSSNLVRAGVRSPSSKRPPKISRRSRFCSLRRLERRT